MTAELVALVVMGLTWGFILVAALMSIFGGMLSDD